VSEKYTVGRIEQLTETPKTDLAIEMAAEVEPFRAVVSVAFARELEQENAKLRGQRDALVKLLMECQHRGSVTWQHGVETPEQYKLRRLAEILGEGNG
jgi:hypothetical protein